MRTCDLVQPLVCLFVIDGEMRSEIGGKDLPRATQLSGAKLESEQEFGLAVCSSLSLEIV